MGRMKTEELQWIFTLLAVAADQGLKLYQLSDCIIKILACWLDVMDLEVSLVQGQGHLNLQVKCI